MHGEGGGESSPDPCARCIASRSDTESSLRTLLGTFWKEDYPGNPYTVYMGYTQQGCEESYSYLHPMLDRGVLKSQVPLGKLPIGWPGDILAMDIFGPLPTARSGARYVLVCIDHFSRWVELAALSQVREDEVMAFLRDAWIPHHGVSRVVLSDNRPQFIAVVLRNLCEPIGARKIYSSPYYPQGNSVRDSFMRTLKKALSALASGDGCDWDVHRQAVAFAHNAALCPKEMS